MPSTLDYLKENGVQINQMVGLMQSEKQPDGQWRVSAACMITIIPKVPPELADHLDDLGFDPDYDLIMTNDPKRETYQLLQIPNEAEGFAMKPSGLILRTSTLQIHLSQAPAFLEDVHACAMMLPDTAS
jgi:hypothetical protein